MTAATLVGLALGVVAPALPVRAVSQDTWTAAGPDNRWSDPLNWSSGVPPTAGDALVFPDRSTTWTSDDDEPSGTQYNSISMGDLGTLSGNGVSLSEGLTLPSNGSAYVSLPITFANMAAVTGDSGVISGPVTLDGTLSVDGAGANPIQLTGSISGPGGIVQDRPGYTALEGANSYTGTTLVRQGTLAVASSSGLGSAAGGTTIDAGASLNIGSSGLSPPAAGLVVSEPITLDSSTGSQPPVVRLEPGWIAHLDGPMSLLGSGSDLIMGSSDDWSSPGLFVDGPVSGGATLEIRGLPALTNPGNSFTGAVDASSLVLSATGALGAAPAITVTGHLDLGTGSGFSTSGPSAAVTVATPLTVNGGFVDVEGTGDAITGPVTVAAGGLAFDAGWLPVAPPNPTVTISGVVSGSGPISSVAFAPTVVTLSGHNTFSGSLAVHSGILQAVGDQSLGAAGNTATVNGELQLSGMSSTSENLVLDGGTIVASCAPDGSCGTLVSTGAISMPNPGAGNDSAIVRADPGETLVLDGDISNVSSAATLELLGSIDLSGPTSYSGSVVAGGLRLLTGAALANAQVLDVDHLLVAGTLAVPTPIKLTGAAPGLESLSGDTTFSGPVTCCTNIATAVPAITVDGGTVVVSGVLSGGGSPSWAFPVEKDGPGTLTLSGSNANPFAGQMNVNDGVLELGKPSGVAALSGPLRIHGAGAVVRLLAGQQLPSQSRPPNTGANDTGAEVVVDPGGLFDLNGFNQTLDSIFLLGGSVSTGSGTLQVGGIRTQGEGSITGNVSLGTATRTFAGGRLTIAATISGGSGAGIDIENDQSVPGTLVVPAGTTDTYSGTTTVGPGSTLEADGALPAGSTVSLGAGGLLAGVGSVGPVNGDGTVQPGDGVSGSLTVGSVTLNSDGSLAAAVGRPGGSCTACGTTVVSLGGVDLSRSPTLSFHNNGGESNGGTWTIVDNRSAQPVAGTFAGLPEGSQFSSGGNSFRISYLGGSAGNSIVVTQLATGATTSATTTTTVSGSPNPSSVSQSVTYTAMVAPVPDGGTVAFSDDGMTMPGCGAVGLDSAGTAACSTTYSASGTHTIVASYTGDATYAGSSGSTNQEVNVAGAYHPLQPTRICDTRAVQSGIAANQCNNGNTRAAGPVGPGGSLTLDVCAGAGASCSLSAVAINVTVTGPSDGSFLTAYPTGVSRPNASNLNFTRGETVANLVEVQVGSNGTITLYNNSGATDVVVDLEGTVVPPSSSSGSPGLYTPIAPQRICDTRPDQPGVVTNQCNNAGGGSTLAGNGTITVQVTGQAGMPSTGVAAVVLNLTATDTSASGYLTAWPASDSRPTASNINWSRGQTVANRVIVPVDQNGQISIYNYSGAADVVVDLGGWYGDGTASQPAGTTLTPITPTRICDTRSDQPGVVTNACNNGGAGRPLSGGETMTVQVSGGTVPAGAKGVVVNVTVTGTAAPGYLTVWPSDVAQPTISDLNWATGETVPNLVVVKLSASGAVNVFNQSGNTDVIIDVVGYYS